MIHGISWPLRFTIMSESPISEETHLHFTCQATKWTAAYSWPLAGPRRHQRVQTGQPGQSYKNQVAIRILISGIICQWYHMISVINEDCEYCAKVFHSKRWYISGESYHCKIDMGYQYQLIPTHWNMFEPMAGGQAPISFVSRDDSNSYNLIKLWYSKSHPKPQVPQLELMHSFLLGPWFGGVLELLAHQRRPSMTSEAAKTVLSIRRLWCQWLQIEWQAEVLLSTLNCIASPPALKKLHKTSQTSPVVQRSISAVRKHTSNFSNFKRSKITFHQIANVDSHSFPHKKIHPEQPTTSRLSEVPATTSAWTACWGWASAADEKFGHRQKGKPVDMHITIRYN